MINALDKKQASQTQSSAPVGGHRYTHFSEKLPWQTAKASGGYILHLALNLIDI